MPRMLKDCIIVDLRHSELLLPSDPKEAKKVQGHMDETCEFQFVKKVYVDYYNRGIRPPYWFTWCRYSKTNDYRDLYEWKVMYGYTPVQKGIDPYWPDGVMPDENGFFVVGDLISVKRNLIDHLQESLENQARTRRGARERLEQFHEHKKAHHGAIPEDMFQELMGNLPK